MFFALLILLVLIFLLIFGGGIYLWYVTPDIKWLREKNPRDTAFMRFRERQHTNNRSDRHWRWVELSQISPYLIQSIIVSEDFNFLTHRGFYWEEMWKSLIANLRSKKIVRGGSSITQQLAKNLFLEPSRSILRKIKEAIITFKLERDLTKWRILEIYLNVIEWGNWVYGAEEASWFYYNRSAATLTLSEAIRLASVIPNPRTLSPLDKTSEFLKLNSQRVLAGILQHGWISRAKYEQVSMDLYHFHASAGEPTSLVPLSDVPPKLLRADYWISKLKNPDEIVMTEGEIEIFNERAQLISSGIDIFGLPDYLPGKEVKDKILEVAGIPPAFVRSVKGEGNPYIYELLVIADHSEAKVRYDDENNPLSEEFFCRLFEKMNLSEIQEKHNVKYGIIVSQTDIRSWPVDDLAMKRPFDYGFNLLQLGCIKVGNPVALFHISEDGEWAFLRSQYIDGWAKLRDLAMATREEAFQYPGNKFLVITSPHVGTKSGIDLQMGSRVTLSKKIANVYEIKLPSKGVNGEFKLKIDKLISEGASEGYLPYTRASVVTQAFRYLGTPYKWGGGRDGLDCSLFIQEIFSVFGINLPRNSAAQTRVGQVIAKFDGKVNSDQKKLANQRNWDPALTILGLPGHIMLYLGEDGRKQYAIHAISRIADKGEDVIDINKVVVTDLHLGQGSRSCALFERIKDVSIVNLEKSGLRSFLKDFINALQHHPWHLFSLFKYLIILFALSVVTVLVVFYR